jgi:hypothetical protein
MPQNHNLKLFTCSPLPEGNLPRPFSIVGTLTIHNPPLARIGFRTLRQVFAHFRSKREKNDVI